MVAFLDLIDSDEDKEKFIQLYNKYNRLVYWIAERRVHKHEIAEECVQETFFSIAKNFHKIGEVNGAATRSYVATIAEGFAIKAFRRENKVVFVQSDDDEKRIQLADPSLDFIPDNVDAIDLSIAIDRYLDDEEKNLIYLRYTYKFKVSELSRMFDTTDYFINKKISIALNKLKDYFEKE